MLFLLLFFVVGLIDDSGELGDLVLVLAQLFKVRLVVWIENQHVFVRQLGKRVVGVHQRAQHFRPLMIFSSLRLLYSFRKIVDLSAQRLAPLIHNGVLVSDVILAHSVVSMNGVMSDSGIAEDGRLRAHSCR